MKQILLLFFAVLSISTSCASCSKHETTTDTMEDTTGNLSTGNKMKIIIGSLVFKATLFNNATAKAFKLLLPLTVDMIELNANEKYVDLPGKLSTNASNPGDIQAGDLMLYGSSTLVLFYKGFTTSYSYTRLGKIEDVSGLAVALGSGNVRVTYELE